MNRDPAAAPAFDALMAEVMAGAQRFGHRQHVHLTWLAVRRYGTVAAIASWAKSARAFAMRRSAWPPRA